MSATARRTGRRLPLAPRFFVRLRGVAADRLAVVTPLGWVFLDCREPVRACVLCRFYTCDCDEAENETHESCREEMAREVAGLPPGPTVVAAPPDNVIHDWQYTDWATLGGKLGAQRGESRKRKGGKKL